MEVTLSGMVMLVRLVQKPERPIPDGSDGQTLMDGRDGHLFSGAGIIGHAVIGTVIRKGKDKSFRRIAFISLAAHRADAVYIIVRDGLEHFLLDKYFFCRRSNACLPSSPVSVQVGATAAASITTVCPFIAIVSVFVSPQRVQV